MPKDPLQYFRIEAKELVEQISTNALALERSTADPTAEVSRLLRLAHTLKGAARVVKQRAIAELAHEIEDVLAPLRAEKAPAPRETVDALLALVDRIVEHVAVLQPTAAPQNGKTPALADAPLPTLRTDVSEMDRLLRGLAEGRAQLGALRDGAAAVGALGQLADVLSRQLHAPRRTRPLDAASAQVGSIAEELRTRLPAVARQISAAADQIDTELRQVRDGAERLRLLPAELMFHALERAARDAAQSLRKHVVFSARGGDVQFDAHALGHVQNALVQLVRNAVAHGIESDVQRRAAGKPAEGSVVLEVARRGERVEFCCRDDGKGIDLEAVRRRAEQSGMPSAQVRALDLDGAIALLLRGGISTAESVTQVSGRGVGLDVVRDAASRLGGEVSVRSEPLQGTRITLAVPASLSSLEVLHVEAAGQRAGIPLGHVRRTLRVSHVDVLAGAQGDSVLVDAQPLPLVSLAQLLRRPGTARDATRKSSAVVLQGPAGGVALCVDRIVGVQHVVWRSLPQRTPADAFVAGVSLDADGTPELVIDPAALVAAARGSTLQTRAEAAPRPSLPVLVIDDSLTTRTLEQSVLESAGFDVDLASSAEEALEKARTRSYGLMLVDIEMPGMDGFEFLERKRADPALAQIPAILVSSLSAPEHLQRAEQVGACGYVVKSEFDQSELLRKIRQLME
jgi:two-component system, chemotaxis family, sensor kinase CheA